MIRLLASLALSVVVGRLLRVVLWLLLRPAGLTLAVGAVGLWYLTRA